MMYYNVKNFSSVLTVSQEFQARIASCNKTVERLNELKDMISMETLRGSDVREAAKMVFYVQTVVNMEFATVAHGQIERRNGYGYVIKNPKTKEVHKPTDPMFRELLLEDREDVEFVINSLIRDILEDVQSYYEDYAKKINEFNVRR